MAEISWIKLDVGLFGNRKVKEIRRQKGGDMTVLIWVMLLTMAGKCNAAGMIWITEGIPYSVASLADELRIKPAQIRAALDTLEEFRMIRVDEDGICVLDWEAHQNVEGMDRVREKTNNRVKAYRDRKKAVMQCNADVTQGNALDERYNVTDCNDNGSVTCNATCNATVTLCNGTDKIREEKSKIREEREKNIYSISGRKEEGKGGVGGTPEAFSPSPPEGEKVISDPVDTQEMDARNDGWETHHLPPLVVHLPPKGKDLRWTRDGGQGTGETDSSAPLRCAQNDREGDQNDARDAQNDGEGRKTMTPAELVRTVREKMELTDGNADELVKFAREIGSNAVLDALNTAIESDQCYWFGLWAQMMKRRYNQ